MDYKMIISDIDGTLLDNNHKIPEGNLEALKKASNMDIPVVLCSGRSKHSVQQIIDMLGLEQQHTYGAGYHGGVIFNSKTGEIVKNYKINKSLIKEVLELTKDYNFTYLIHDDESLYTLKSNEFTKMYEDRCGDVCHEIKFEDLNEMVSKLIIMGNNEELKKFEKTITKEISEKCMHFFASGHLYEFINIDVSKGNALKFLCDELGIKQEETIGFGDNFNDMALVKEAGLGVAVANAVPELKEIAEYVTEKNNSEGAIEEVLNKFVF